MTDWESLLGHYVDKFNAQDEETVVQQVGNAQTCEWMKEQIP